MRNPWGIRAVIIQRFLPLDTLNIIWNSQKDNMVHVDAMTASAAEYIEADGSVKMWPYVVLCGTIEQVQQLKDSPFMLVAEGRYSRIHTTDFILEKLLELS